MSRQRIHRTTSDTRCCAALTAWHDQARPTVPACLVCGTERVLSCGYCEHCCEGRCREHKSSRFAPMR